MNKEKDYFNIPFVGIKIIIGLFAHGKCEHHDERTNVGNKESNSKYFDELCECSNKKEHIVEEFELIIEDKWDKSKKIVFCIFNQVVLIVYWDYFTI